MSDTRTGDRTPSRKRRHSTGQRDVDTAKNLDNAGPPCKEKRNARSESSAGRAERSEMCGSHWKHDRQFMTNEPSFHLGEAKHETSPTAFGVRDNGPRDLDTSLAGSWCKRE